MKDIQWYKELGIEVKCSLIQSIKVPINSMILQLFLQLKLK